MYFDLKTFANFSKTCNKNQLDSIKYDHSPNMNEKRLLNIQTNLSSSDQ